MIECTHFPSVINVTCLGDVRVRRLKDFGQRKNYDPVGNHIQWVSLRHTLPNI